MKKINYAETRRRVGAVGIWNTLVLEYRNPYIIAFWSIACAGLGHILLDRYYRGFILITGEIYLNLVAHLNAAIFYTISGRFDLAKGIINPKALLIYLAVYCFAIFDSYRDCIVINDIYRVADRENAQIKCFAMNSHSFTIIEKVTPYLAMIWSAIIPGSGSFMVERMDRAFYLMILWSFNIYLSGLYAALIYTFSGQFELAKAAVDIHWLLNIPSIWCFGMYDAYCSVIENNKMLRRELTNFLSQEYKTTRFSMSDILRKV